MDADTIGSETDTDNSECNDRPWYTKLPSNEARDRELSAVTEHLYTAIDQLNKMTRLVELLIKQREK